MPSKPKAAEEASALIADQCLAVRVRALGRAVTAVYDEEMRAFGITTGQVNILVSVNELTARVGRAPAQSEVGAVLAMEKSTLSRNVERLIRDGLVKSVHGDDARVRLLEVTRQGNAMITKLLPAWKRAQKKARELVGGDVEKALRGAVDDMWKKAAG